jgi:hypothetical protein
MFRPLSIASLILAASLSGAAEAVSTEGRYQVLPLTDAEGGLGSDKVFIIDTVAGHLWTWTEIPAGDGGSGGRFLIYQGQVRPGTKLGEMIEQQTWEGEKAPEPARP